MSLKEILQQSELPTDIKQLILRVVRSTRLRRGERLDIASELIVHFEDALEQGIDPAQAIKAYGDVKTAAKLLRASKKRQRWWVERMFVRTCKWSAVSIGCLFLVYVGLVGAAMLRKPTIKVDYIAKANAQAASIAQDDRAWPIYREVGISLRDHPEPQILVDGQEQRPRSLDDEGANEYAAWLETQRDSLALIREGASKKGLGYIAAGSIAKEDRELWPDAYEDGVDQDNGMIVSVLIPHLSLMREMAGILRFDALLGARDGDLDRCIADITAMISIGVQCREHHFLINDLVAISIFKMGFQTIRETLQDDPIRFSTTQIASLRQALLDLDDHLNIRFDGERWAMLDTVQHIYTDDGNGDGVIVPGQFFRMVSFLNTVSTQDDSISLLSVLATPLGDLFQPSRKELIEAYDAKLEAAKRLRDVPLYTWDEHMTQDVKGVDQTSSVFIALLMPAFEHVMLQELYVTSYRDGMLAVLYAVDEFKTTGAWPNDLADAGVIDGWSGEPLRIAATKTSITIYSIGADQDDDGGDEEEQAYEWKPHDEVIDGDWVFFSLKR